MKKKFLIPLLLSGMLSTAFAADVIQIETVQGKKVDMHITEKGFNFEQYKGKAVLLNFFGPHCPPCLAEMPHLIDMQAKNKDNLVILAVQVQMQMTQEKLKEFIKEKKINYPVINLDHAMELTQFIQTNTSWAGQIPFMLLFDKEGKLLQTYLGMTDVSRIERDLNK